MFPLVTVQFNNKHSCLNKKIRFSHSKVISSGDSQMPVRSEKMNKRTALFLFIYLHPLVKYYSTCLQGFCSIATTKDKWWQKLDTHQKEYRRIQRKWWAGQEFHKFLKNKAILADIKSRECLGGEEDHQAIGDPSPNPTSLQLTDHHLPFASLTGKGEGTHWEHLGFWMLPKTRKIKKTHLLL